MRELKPLDPGAATPQEIWLDYFSKRRPTDLTLRETVLKLHQSKRHDHVIALIEAALIHGQPMPWMYEVLAISYELDGRPEADVERALLSGIDPSVDFESMMISSAYLARYEKQRPSLRLYRQASKQAPHRPEPYILGLPLARKLNDIDALEWAVVGILNYAWGGNYEPHQQSAEIAAEEAVKALKQQNRFDRARAFEKAVAEARVRDLLLELSWSGEGDVDLVVEEPDGAICSFENTHTAAGGVHRMDGFGPKPKNCVEKYVCVQALSGSYRVRVRHVWGNVVGSRAVLKITRYAGTDRETVKTIAVPLGEDDQIVRVVVDNGRRQKPNAALKQQQHDTRLWRFAPARRTARVQRPLTREQQAVLQRFQQAQQTNPGIIAARGLFVGYEPIITPINEGALLGAAAIVSPDRRYVRIGINQTFSAITEVFNFTVFGGQNGAQNPAGLSGNGN